MADEAFALSPISARATLPGEEDYAAIAEAFMETSRGRWFLTEYAKRNRNADTRMVLDAVARIEQSLVAQREENLQREAALQRDDGLSAQQAAEAVAKADAAQERLTEALAAIRGAVDDTEESAVEALDSMALEQRLAPVRKGARVLREIAWRLREIGNDGRICDLIDSQVTVIESSTDQLSADEAKIALHAAFSALQGRLLELGDHDGSTAAVAAVAEEPSPSAQAMPEAADTIETILTEKAAVAPVAPAPAPAATMLAALEAALADVQSAQTAPPPAAAAQHAVSQEPVPQEPVHRAAASATPAREPADDFAVQDVALQDNTIDDDAIEDDAALNADAEDDALLGMIAMEMGAPDPIDDGEIAEEAVEHARLAEVERSFAAALAAEERSRPAATLPQPVQAAVQPAPQPAPAPVPVAAPAPAPPPVAEVSLGASIIASGMLRKPVTAANDPLAPIRRMSQAEKIAFFS
ncbi:MAG: hypothetical protein ABW175_02250 [Bradyrhizobium sp.]